MVWDNKKVLMSTTSYAMLSKIKRAFSVGSWKPSKDTKETPELHKSFDINSRPSKTGCAHYVQPKTTFVTNYGLVPLVLVNASKILMKNLDVKGLFQTQGSLEKVTHLVSALSRYRPTVPSTVSIHDVAEVVKVYLTRVSSTVIPEEVMALLAEAHQSKAPEDLRRAMFRFRELSPGVVPAVHYVLSLFKKVSEHSSVNGMDTGKMATIFVIDVLKLLSTVENDEFYEKNRLQIVQKLPYDIMAIEYLINNVHLFEEINNNVGRQRNGAMRNRKERSSLPTPKISSHVPVQKTKRPQIIIGSVSHSPPRQLNTTKSNNAPADLKKTVDDAGLSAIKTESQNEMPMSVSKSIGNIPPVSAQKRAMSKSPVKARSRNLPSLSPSRRKDLSWKHQEQQQQQQLQLHLKNQPQQKSKAQLALYLTSPRTSNTNSIQQVKAGVTRSLPRASQHESGIPKGGTAKGRRARNGSKPSESRPDTRMLFKTHEELLPWCETQRDDGDDSHRLISKSILNPLSFRFLDEYHLGVKPGEDSATIDVDYSVTVKTNRAHRSLSEDSIKVPRLSESFENNSFANQMTIKKNSQRQEELESRCKLPAHDKAKVNSKSGPTGDQPKATALDATVLSTGHRDARFEKGQKTKPNPSACGKNLIYTNEIKINYSQKKRRRLPRPKIMRGSNMDLVVDVVLVLVAIVCATYVHHIGYSPMPVSYVKHFIDTCVDSNSSFIFPFNA